MRAIAGIIPPTQGRLIVAGHDVALDPRGIRTMKKSLLDRAAQGAAIVISSHLLALVEDLCTHLLILHKGVPRFVGPVAEARAAFMGAAVEGVDHSLEDVFFRATEEQQAEAQQLSRQNVSSKG